MSGWEQGRAAGRRRGARLSREVSQAALDGRLNRGLARRPVAAALGISESKLRRWELAQEPLPSIPELGTWLAVLGLRLAVNVYPGGVPLRDAGHVRLMNRFLALVPASVPRSLEVPIPRDRDLRAWDALLQLDGARMGVAAETHLRDEQELLRREQLKARDSGVGRILLVLADTAHNRRAVRESGPGLRSVLPLEGRAVLAALRRGRDPGRNGLLFV
jgi:transcriptional regulator with XRE-family HTH domain